MNIRGKLSVTFILLLIFGVTAVSSYSILFIRNYLLDEGKVQLAKDAEQLRLALEFAPVEKIPNVLEEFEKVSGYNIQKLNEPDSTVLADDQKRIDPSLQVTYYTGEYQIAIYHSENDEVLFAYVPYAGGLSDQLVKVSQTEEILFEPIKVIRWIIYTGMFISIVLIFIVSTLMARSISKPILQLKEGAQKIAGGEVEHALHLDRNDEFGELAESLNKMAGKLRDDTERLQEMYDRHRQFYADITHEVKNPLHTIRGSLEMLELEDLPEHQRENYLNVAEKQIDRLSRLFNDMLMLQRYDDDKAMLSVSHFDICEMAERMVKSYGYRAKEQNIKVTYSCTGSNFLVKADEDKIEQVFDNLLINALKYSEATNIQIKIEANKSSVNVGVCDNGVGIPAAHHDQLFDRFYRADEARSRSKGGTGLGLAVVDSILQKHNTQIRLESNPGDGARFYFSLPKA